MKTRDDESVDQPEGRADKSLVLSASMKANLIDLPPHLLIPQSVLSFFSRADPEPGCCATAAAI
jgi:hypothetical protein